MQFQREADSQYLTLQIVHFMFLAILARNIRMNSPSTPVEPVSPAAPWLGGKRNLAKRICGIIDRTACTTYAEPFVGMGGIFLRRTTRPRCEVINERAARFLYLQRTAFGGKISGRNFGVVTDRPGRFNLTTLEPMLEDLHSRLAGVIIECLDWADFIPRYDREGTLFYLDPPYWGCEGDYGKALFSRADFGRMAEVLARLKGRFILSINDVPEIREIFGSFQLTGVTTSYTISRTGNDQAGARAELLVSNFPIPATT
jgi:DNA adenine methylase